MERPRIFDMMAQLKVYGMRAGYDEVMNGFVGRGRARIAYPLQG